MGPESLPDPIAVAIQITGVLDRLGIRYLVGGSLASSVHGEPRSTNDIDLVVDFREEHIEAFVEAVRPDYYASVDAIRDAVRSGHSFNVIHMDAAMVEAPPKAADSLRATLPLIPIHPPIHDPHQATRTLHHPGVVRRKDERHPTVVVELLHDVQESIGRL